MHNVLPVSNTHSHGASQGQLGFEIHFSGTPLEVFLLLNSKKKTSWQSEVLLSRLNLWS